MATITIEIEDIVNTFSNTADFVEGEMAEALHRIAGIIEAAIENAFDTEAAPEYGSVSVSIDGEDDDVYGDN